LPCTNVRITLMRIITLRPGHPSQVTAKQNTGSVPESIIFTPGHPSQVTAKQKTERVPESINFTPPPSFPGNC
jgi:hypothetical protein